jgi:hypothetical protein
MPEVFYGRGPLLPFWILICLIAALPRGNVSFSLYRRSWEGDGYVIYAGLGPD